MCENVMKLHLHADLYGFPQFHFKAIRTGCRTKKLVPKIQFIALFARFFSPRDPLRSVIVQKLIFIAPSARLCAARTPLCSVIVSKRLFIALFAHLLP